jgi:hypothetical protein
MPHDKSRGAIWLPQSDIQITLTDKNHFGNGGINHSF